MAVGTTLTTGQLQLLLYTCWSICASIHAVGYACVYVCVCGHKQCHVYLIATSVRALILLSLNPLIMTAARRSGTGRFLFVVHSFFGVVVGGNVDFIILFHVGY